MEFIFKGNADENDNVGQVVAFGIVFPLNTAVDVEDDAINKKLMGNPEFECADGTDDRVDPSVVEKEHLLAVAESLGINASKRWGVERLRREINTVKANDDEDED